MSQLVEGALRTGAPPCSRVPAARCRPRTRCMRMSSTGDREEAGSSGRPDCLVKLGGSAITVKVKDPFLHLTRGARARNSCRVSEPELGGEQESFATPRARERMGSPTLQTLQDAILPLSWVCFLVAFRQSS